MSAPKITAIICTHNRQDYLGKAIDSLLQQDYCDHFEVLVVDNKSTDSTKTIVKSRLSDPRLRYVYEDTLGLSAARNRGYKESSSPILAYLDDDAIASDSWLTNIVAAYEEAEVAIAGGKVSLIYPEGVTLPTWLSKELSAGLGLYDLGDSKLYIQQAGLTPRGLNYSIRRSFLEEVGGFDLKLGRLGTRLLSNEELYMTELALNKGWKVAYLPKALVAHHVTLERLQASWFLRRSWWQGKSEHYREVVAGQTGIAQLGRGSERIVRGLYKSVKYWRNKAICFDNLVYAYGQLGYLDAAIRDLLKR